LIVFVDLNKGREAIWIINPVSQTERWGFVFLGRLLDFTGELVEVVIIALLFRAVKGISDIFRLFRTDHLQETNIL